MASISVILCTYNPNESIFQKCLDSVSVAASEEKVKEILIIDNNSQPPLSQSKYIQEFLLKEPNSSYISEKQQGLTPARIRGMEEATGDLLVFIDDDNFLSPNYFEIGKKIAETHPFIGTFSGQVSLLFEKEPEAWTEKYRGMLVNRKLEADKWSNLPHNQDTMAGGAGMFVRKSVADYYTQLHKTGKRKIQLDRTGNSLMSGGDNDISASACDIGLGMGVFKDLNLEHFIPAFRTTEKYLIRLAEGIALSSIIFHSFRNVYLPTLSLKNKLANAIRRQIMKGPDRKIFDAVLRGEKKGRETLLRNGVSTDDW